MTEKVGQNANDTVISEILEMNPELEGIGNYEYGWADSDEAIPGSKARLDEDVVRDISAKKNEPQWMLDMRLKALKFFERKPMPTWGADLSEIDFDNIKYFVRSTEARRLLGRNCPRTSAPPTSVWAFPRRSVTPSSRVWLHSTSLRSCTTRSVRTWRSRA